MSAADRNLLFGILALQMDFVSRDQLVAAMHAWVLDKAQPLSEILCERGDLDADTRALIDALVQKHLAQHGGDPRRSLAALSVLDPPARQDLGAIADADVQASLVQVGAARQTQSGLGGAPTNPVPAAELPQPPTAAVCYRVLRLHARGGLGEVYVAEDCALGRQVAMKEIQARHADNPTSRARFLLEAEVTGNLEHPGVVPVYGLGAHADGRPFYVMRFIQGDNLQQAIRRFHAGGRPPGERALAFRELLGRFVDVCQAMAYAHSRGVLHRDLKPANVLLGRYGETLVVDWGLAKPLGRREAADDGEATLRPRPGSEATATAPGGPLGTPAYMSPEQADGRLDDLGPATDVYSLGVTLYEILTGRVPFGGKNAAATLIDVLLGRFRPPRAVAPDVPPALEAVCLRAMALAPAARYGGALELAAEVERWLADEPVQAYREPWPDRARRWVKRHRPLVAAAASLLVMAVVLLTVLTVHSERARQALEREQAQTAAERDAKEEQRRKAEAARADAERQRDRASAARQRTRQALDDMVSGVTGDALTVQKALSAEQRAFLQNVLAYYEEFAAEPDDDWEGQERLAKAHLRLALISARLGQAENGARAFRRGAELYARLTAEHPGVPEYHGALAASRTDLGTLLVGLGRQSEAEAEYRAALAVLERLAAEQPAVPRYRQGLARSRANLARLLAGLGRQSEAEAGYRAALAVLERLAADHPGTPGYGSEWARVRTNLGALLDRLGRRAEAEAEYRAALAVQQKLAADHPGVPEYRWDLAGSRNNLGLLLAGLGRRSAAEAEYQAAAALFEWLVAEYPGVTLYAVELGGCYCNLGNFVRRGGDSQASLAWYEKAIRTTEPLVRRDARLVMARNLLRNVHWGRAQALARLSRFVDSVIDWDRAIALADGSASAGLRLGRADALARAGEHAKAAAEADELAALKGAGAETLYDCACVLALAFTAAHDAAALSEKYAARAVGLLRRSFTSGYADVPHMLKDRDLDGLRRRADYAALLWDLADGLPPTKP